MTTPGAPAAEFDEYAADYEAALSQGLAVSGESSEYFARGRIEWLAQLLSLYGVRPSRVMDFGCGRGSTAPMLLEGAGAESLIGVDVSQGLLDLARAEFGSERVQFAQIDAFAPRADVDVAYCNGVFHHIPLAERPGAADYVFRSLRPGGVFALWENNPWNPGTRYVMSRIPFDRDAITLSHRTAAAMVRAAGFEVLGRWFLFYFPAALSFLRPLERLFVRVPLGAQYCVLARKPGGAAGVGAETHA